MKDLKHGNSNVKKLIVTTMSLMNVSRCTHRHMAFWAPVVLLQSRSLFAAAEVPNGFLTDVKPVAGLEGDYFDIGPDISADDLTIYFASRDRPNGMGSTDIYAATRASRSDPFGPPVNLGSPINTAYSDTTPNISPDGLTFYFTSKKPDGFGDHDLYQATRSTKQDSFSDATNLGTGVNASSGDWSPSVSADGLTLYFGSDRAGGGFAYSDIYVATRNSLTEPFGNVVKLGPAINTDTVELHLAISPDGLHLVFSRLDYPANGSRGYNMHVASRASLLDDFGQSVDLNQFGGETTINTFDCSKQGGVFSWDYPALGSNCISP